MMTEPMLNVEALNNVCRALRECTNPAEFTMNQYMNHCGTPACCLGHYARRTDLQSTFWMTDLGNIMVKQDNTRVDFDDQPVLDHFGINIVDAYALFASGGCGNAKTPEHAARYIEHFIDRRTGACDCGESTT